MTRGRGAAFILLLAGFAPVCFLTAAPYPDNQDGVNFILGVERYELAEHRPHFPGYVVYVALGKLVSSAGLSAEWALVSVGMISTMAAAGALYLLAAPRAGPAGALALTASFLFIPAVFAFSHKIFSEPLGLALLMAAFAAAPETDGARGRFMASGALAGLLLGARLSWWPFALVLGALAVTRHAAGAFMAGVAAGAAAWLIPMVSLTGGEEMARIALSFTQGHFSEWGGAPGALSAPEGRGALFAANLTHTLGANPSSLSGLVWMGTFAAALATWKPSVPRGRIAWLAGAAAVYLAWLYAGQNVGNARHFLPVVPAALLMLSPFAARFPVLVAAGALSLAVSLMPALEAGAPPSARLRGWLNTLPPDTELLCGATERFFDRYPARARVRYVAHARDLPLEAGGRLHTPVLTLVCDDIPGYMPAGPLRAVFAPRPGDPVDRELRVYDWDD